MTVLHAGPVSDLRRYGTWGENAYVYGHTGQQAVAIHRFTWVQPVISKEGGHAITLNYFSDAVVDPRRMNEIAYLAAKDKEALIVLHAMVQAAVDGVAYIGLPSPAVEISRDVIQVLGAWVQERSYPETWAQEMSQVIAQSIQKMEGYAQRLTAVRAVPDPKRPWWGLAFTVQPITPREDT